MVKTKVREISLIQSKGTFSIFKKSLSKEDYDFTGLSALRQLFNNEKARILHTIKSEEPQSIYDLAKKLNRDFKSVKEDLKLLERFGFIQMVGEKTKNRVRHRPEIIVDNVVINVKL